MMQLRLIAIIGLTLTLAACYTYPRYPKPERRVKVSTYCTHIKRELNYPNYRNTPHGRISPPEYFRLVKAYHKAGCGDPKLKGKNLL